MAKNLHASFVLVVSIIIVEACERQFTCLGMPGRASSALHINRQLTRPLPQTGEARAPRSTLRVVPQQVSNHHSVLCPSISELMEKGHVDFVLSNGAEGRFIFQEITDGYSATGYYLGFALKNIDGEGYTIYGRAVVDVESQHVVRDGNATLHVLNPENACAELYNDSSTPMLISDGIKSGYGGVGSTLVQLGVRFTRKKGYRKIRIILSVADGFYAKVGFAEVRKDEAGWYLMPQNTKGKLMERLDKRAQIKPRAGILADWRPAEGVAKRHKPDFDASVLDSFATRMKRKLLGVFGVKSPSPLEETI